VVVVTTIVEVDILVAQHLDEDVVQFVGEGVNRQYIDENSDSFTSIYLHGF
jgi:hypothetical protein